MSRIVPGSDPPSLPRKGEEISVSAVLAQSLDGIIHPSGATGSVRLGSDADIRHLKTCRQQADVLLMGSKTFRAYPKRHPALEKTHRPCHALLTRGLDPHRSLPPDAPLFRDGTVPVVIFSAQEIDPNLQAAYSPAVTWVTVPDASPETQIKRILADLQGRGYQRLLVEGGGEILALFLKAKALAELHLTLCPLLLGGEDSTSLLEGPGFPLDQAPRTRLLSVRQEGSELFLHLALDYPP